MPIGKPLSAVRVMLHPYCHAHLELCKIVEPQVLPAELERISVHMPISEAYKCFFDPGSTGALPCPGRCIGKLDQALLRRRGIGKRLRPRLSPPDCWLSEDRCYAIGAEHVPALQLLKDAPLQALIHLGKCRHASVYSCMKEGSVPASAARAISSSAAATASSFEGPICQRAASLISGAALATATPFGTASIIERSFSESPKQTTSSSPTPRASASARTLEPLSQPAGEISMSGALRLGSTKPSSGTSCFRRSLSAHLSS
jgi:hypothetical protein